MNRWRCPPALTSPRVDLGIGDVRMGSVAHNSEIRNGLVAGGVGLVGGLGGGITTMAGPQVFPKAPTWIWESLFWLESPCLLERRLTCFMSTWFARADSESQKWTHCKSSL